MARFRIFRTLHFKVASGVIATIVFISSLQFLADYRSNRRHLQEELRTSADQLAGIALQGLLELAMSGEHPELLQQAIERLGANSPVQRILLLDLAGQVRFSSNSGDLGRRFSLRQEGCRPCHGRPSPDLHHSEYMEIGGQEILRHVTPVPNRSECHSCHDPAARYNGVLLMDFPTAPIRERLRADLGDTLYRAGLTVLATLVVLGILMNKLVIMRLKKLTRATASVNEAEAPPELSELQSSDEIGQLAESFREMARRVNASFEKLQSQGEYLQTLMNSLPDGLVVVDRGGRVEMTNQTADRIWKSWEPTDSPAAGQLFPEVGQALRKTFEKGALVTCEIKSGAGQADAREADRRGPRFVEIYCSPVRDSGGEITKAVLLVRDVTRRKAFESQASRADRLATVGRLAAGLAHEINNPMAAITTCVEGLSRHVENSRQIGRSAKNEIRDYLCTVGEAAERCKEITQRLLGASVEQGPSEFEPVDLREVVRDALTLVEHQARRQGALVDWRPCAVPASVMANRRRLSQLVLNLLLNALEAVAEGGAVDVSVSRLEEFVRLEVSDDGCGIPESDIEHIFDPFFTTKSEGRGTGLGLSIAQWVVRQHQGRMHVRSQPEQGTTFTVLIPGIEDEGP